MPGLTGDPSPEQGAGAEGMLWRSAKCFQLLVWRVSCADAKGVL